MKNWLLEIRQKLYKKIPWLTVESNRFIVYTVLAALLAATFLMLLMGCSDSSGGSSNILPSVTDTLDCHAETSEFLCKSAQGGDNQVVYFGQMVRNCPNGCPGSNWTPNDPVNPCTGSTLGVTFTCPCDGQGCTQTK